jgi:hypothetical protein
MIAEQNPMTGQCEYGNETSGLTKYGFLGAFAKLRKATISFVMSVRLPSWNISAPTGRIFMKSDI